MLLSGARKVCLAEVIQLTPLGRNMRLIDVGLLRTLDQHPLDLPDVRLPAVRCHLPHLTVSPSETLPFASRPAQPPSHYMPPGDPSRRTNALCQDTRNSPPHVWLCGWLPPSAAALRLKQIDPARQSGRDRPPSFWSNPPGALRKT